KRMKLPLKNTHSGFGSRVLPGALRLGATFLLASLTAGTSFAAELDVERHYPNNLIDTEETVRFDVKIKVTVPEGAALHARMLNEKQEEFARTRLAELDERVQVDFGTPGRGYYELEVRLSTPDGEAADGEATLKPVPLGVVDFIDRSA